MGFVGALVVDLLMAEWVLFRAWRLARGLHMWWAPLCGVYILGLLVPVGYLFVFHLYLTARNLTTNELINAHRYQHEDPGRGHGHSHGPGGQGHSHQNGSCDGNHSRPRPENPFDRGLLLNFSERCLPEFAAGSSSDDRDPLLPSGRSSRRQDPALLV